MANYRLDLSHYPPHFGVVFTAVLFLMTACILGMMEPWNAWIDSGDWKAVSVQAQVTRSEKARLYFQTGHREGRLKGNRFRTEFQISDSSGEMYAGVVFSDTPIALGSAAAQRSMKNRAVYRLQNTTLCRSTPTVRRSLQRFCIVTFLMTLFGVYLIIKQRQIGQKQISHFSTQCFPSVLQRIRDHLLPNQDYTIFRVILPYLVFFALLTFYEYQFYRIAIEPLIKYSMPISIEGCLIAGAINVIGICVFYGFAKDLRVKTGKLKNFELDFSGNHDEQLRSLTQADWQTIHRTVGRIHLILNAVDVTDEEMKSLKNNSCLKELSLYETPNLTENVLVTLRSCKNLTHLRPGDWLSDSGLEKVARIRTLESLDLSFNDKITGEGIQYLTRLENLQFLSLADNEQTTDALLAVLARISTLRCVDLSFCDKITKEGVLTLAKIPSLQQVDLRHCPQFDKTSIKQIKEKMRVKILF